jgi:hypothetical protein
MVEFVLEISIFWGAMEGFLFSWDSLLLQLVMKPIFINIPLRIVFIQPGIIGLPNHFWFNRRLVMLHVSSNMLTVNLPVWVFCRLG